MVVCLKQGGGGGSDELFVDYCAVLRRGFGVVKEWESQLTKRIFIEVGRWRGEEAGQLSHSAMHMREYAALGTLHRPCTVHPNSKHYNTAKHADADESII